MKRTTLTHEELMNLKVGDVVLMHRGNASDVTAPIAHIEHRWGTGALPLITLEGHDDQWTKSGPDGAMNYEGDRCAGAHMVMEIIERAPYQVQSCPNTNVFAEYRAKRAAEGAWNWPRKDAPKGQLCGRYGQMDELFMFALGALPYEIVTALHGERAVTLWEQAGSPGLIAHPTPCDGTLGSILSGMLDEEKSPHMFVSEKQFCRFVQQNWSKLVMTRAEMDQDADELDQEMADQYSRDMDDLFGGNSDEWDEEDDRFDQAMGRDDDIFFDAADHADDWYDRECRY